MALSEKTGRVGIFIIGSYGFLLMTPSVVPEFWIFLRDMGAPFINDRL